MAMFRIKCSSCNWTTVPHYSKIDCIKEKEVAHMFGIKENGYDAHDSAFGDMCPKCGGKTAYEYKYFSDAMINRIKREKSML